MPGSKLSTLQNLLFHLISQLKENPFAVGIFIPIIPIFQLMELSFQGLRI